MEDYQGNQTAVEEAGPLSWDNSRRRWKPKRNQLDRSAQSPFRLLVIIVVAIFFAEVIAMIVIDIMAKYSNQQFPYSQIILIDAGIMTILIFPVLYLFSFNPIIRHMEKRRQAEESLVHSAELQEQFFDSIDTLIAYMDRDFNFIRVNESYAKTDGRQPGFYIGRNHFDLYPDAENLAIFQQVVQTGNGFSVYEKPFEYPDHPEWGITYWNWSLLPVKHRGAVVGVVLSLVDVTERVQARQQLERQNHELRILSAAEHEQRLFAETLRTSAQALTQSLDLERVIQAVLQQLRSLVQADTASVFFLEGESTWTVHGVDGYGDWNDPERIPSITLEEDHNLLLQKLISTKKSVLIPDTKEEVHWQVFPGTECIRSYIGVPMISEDRMIGFVGLGKTRARYFDEVHIQRAEALVAHATVAIQNAWLFDQVRAGRERLQFLSHRLVEVQESERRYIARELHDQAGQSLSFLMLGLGQLEKDANQLVDTQSHVQKLKELTNDILEDLHRLAVNLRPASLDHLGLVPALDQFIKSFAMESRLQIRFRANGLQETDRLPIDMETTLYRIVQESLTNILRHAKASHADVILEYRDDSLILIVEDNGIGFDAELPHLNTHVGLLGIQERAEMLGGKLTIESVPGQGTTLVVEVPNVNPNPVGR